MTTLAGTPPAARARMVEWATFALITACYGFWFLAVFWLADVSLLLTIVVTILLVALHSSLTHEALHGHPFPSKAMNEALMALPLSLFIPYNRFRDQHLAHHRDSTLTDPYDDPESNYLDPAVWAAMPRWKRAVLKANNTLLGRMLLGPLIGQMTFLKAEWAGALQGDRAIWLAWGLHLPGVAAVLALVMASGMPVWAYVTAAYCALGVLKIRTFLEHRAHEQIRGRTVIIEDRGPLAFLFLNNNLHAVHHMHPSAPWYRLPALYRTGRDRYLSVNDGYVFRSYGEVFRRFFWRAKDPVPHPLWPKP
ncbi:fatty acid desaturase [Sedimentitalea sp. JM2-8]|uniref:Fatty acid desaturase n=1 Tax=Sedimentitalea xiamensis TaxID=3050037 RepID=A0ABT7FFG3_9RHOB|nr:fatty acid desaturase [Sedimentitalea xiamensis]MDK3073871.1 fatty acid desaturase [Sedimentitalea xiamensis]